MIFISHNSKDKVIIEPIAEALARAFGRENVFYDSWSIQPGDSIISKMDSGLEKCKYFFFFVSENSLNSKMVALEWQAALMKRADLRFIPVRLDRVIMPAIIAQTLYIDLFAYGIDIAVRQMIDVINGQNIYRPNKRTHNLIAYRKDMGDEILIEVRAEYYLEPHSYFVVVVDNEQSDLTCWVVTSGISINGFNKGVKLGDEIVNAFYLGVAEGTSPGFPFRIKLKKTGEKDMKILSVWHEAAKGLESSKYDFVPMQVI